MAVAFVQIATGNTQVTPLTMDATWGGATTAGNLLFAVISIRSPGMGTTASAVVPPAGKGWTSITSCSANYGNGGGRTYMEIFYSANAASQSGAQTWTWTGAGYMSTTNAIVSMVEYSGIDTATPLDVSANHVSPNDAGAFAYTTETTAVTGTTGTTAQANEFAIAALASITALSNPSGSYTERLDGGTVTGAHYLSVSDKVLSGTGTQSTSATYTPAAVNNGAIAVFKFTAAPPPSTAVPHILTLGVG